MRCAVTRIALFIDLSFWLRRSFATQGKNFCADEGATRGLLNGTLRLDELQEGDLSYVVEQKGVDIKMGVDIASLAYKRLVDRIVLMTGGSDFVPAAKLARRERIDVVLDPLWAPISASLNEHIDGLRTYWPRRSARGDGSAMWQERVAE